MKRMRKSNGADRTKMIGVKVTEEELRRVRTEAAKHNQTIGAFVRERLADVIATKHTK